MNYDIRLSLIFITFHLDDIYIYYYMYFIFNKYIAFSFIFEIDEIILIVFLLLL